MPNKTHQFYFNPKSWEADLAVLSSGEMHESPTALELVLISESEINPDVFSKLPPWLKFLKINLNPLVYRDPAVMRKLGEVFNALFRCCQELTELDLSACRFYGEQQLDIGALLKNAPPSLRELSLRGQFLSEGEDLCRFLRQLPPSIRELDLSSNLIGSINLYVFQWTRGNFPRQPDLLKEFMEALPPTLEFIDLSNNRIEDITIERLAEILSAETLNPAMWIKLLADTADTADKTSTIAELRVLMQSLLLRGWEKRAYKEVICGLAQENALFMQLQELPKAAPFIDVSKISLQNISIARLSKILWYAGGSATTRIKLLPNKTTSIGELARLVQSLNPTDKLKPYNELIACPLAAISWSETGALRIDFDNAQSCDAVVNELSVRAKEYVVPKSDRNSLVYVDNPDGLVFRRPEPNTLLLTPYKPPLNQAGHDHIGVNFTTQECLRSFLVQLFHIEPPPEGVSSTYYVDRVSHQLKRVDSALFHGVAGHKRKDVLFELVINSPNTLFLNSAHPLFQQGFVLELKQSNPLSHDMILDVVSGYIPRFEYQDRLSLLLSPEQDFNEWLLLETWVGRCGNSIAAWHYEVGIDQQRGLWLLNNSSISDDQFKEAQVHPQIAKYMLNKAGPVFKLFGDSAAAKHANWIFVPESYLQKLKEKDTQFGSRPLFDWLKARLPKTTNKAIKRPDIKQLPIVMTAIDEEWIVVDGYHP